MTPDDIKKILARGRAPIDSLRTCDAILPRNEQLFIVAAAKLAEASEPGYAEIMRERAGYGGLDPRR